MNLKNYMIFIFLSLALSVFGQQKTVVGTVLDEDGFPLVGASIIVQGSHEGVVADEHGVFSIQVQQGQVLEVSYVFFQTQYVNVGEQNSYAITLISEESIMDDIIVVAYGTATKESITGSISSIDAAQIEHRPLANAAGALEGAAAGIQVNNTSGQPGSDPTIRIRGFTSVNGSNSPLFVVDGMPYPYSISDINPADIESISVLKDASASTLYGNKASNGVVLITTKKASKGDSTLKVAVKQGFYQKGIKEYDRLGADDFMQISWLGYRNRYWLDPSLNMTKEQANNYVSQNLIDDVLGVNIYNTSNSELFDHNGKLRQGVGILSGYRDDLDWYAPLERLGYRQDYTISGRATNDKGGSYFSLGLLNDQSYIVRADYKRLSARVKSDYKVNSWLNVGANLAGSYQETGLVNGDETGSYQNPFMFSRNIAPIYPVHLHDKVTGAYLLDSQGNYRYDGGGSEGSGRPQYASRHVIWENELNSETDIRSSVTGFFFADISFLNDFTFTLRADLGLVNSETSKYDNAIIGDGATNNGRSKRTTYRRKSYTVQQLLKWQKSFGDHKIDALVGHENYSQEFNYMSGRKSDQKIPGMIDWINFNDVNSLTGFSRMYRTEGYLSRVKYDYQNKYFAETSFRRDGSSKFHKDHRWGNFWSIGGGWIVSHEDFYNVSFIDYLKFRTSYGEVGNDSGASVYAYQTFYKISSNGGLGALYASQNGNESLRWETSSSLDIAIESRLFNRVNLTVEYFDKASQNLLFDMNLPLSQGSTSTSSAKSTLTKNMGKIANRGLEITADVEVLRRGGFRWDISANATVMKNKVVRLPLENRESGIRNGNKHISEGKSMYEFYLYQYVGVDTQSGRALYKFDSDKFYIGQAQEGKTQVKDMSIVKEINGEYYALNSTYAKKEFSGSAIPKVYGSFSSSLSYNNFSLSGLFTYSIGGKAYDSTYRSLMSASQKPSAIHKDILGAYDMENPIDAPILYGGIPSVNYLYSSENNLSNSNRFLIDASYLVIKNINLNYSFPKPTLNKMGISKLSVNAGIENLATLTKRKGMNPQQSFSGSMGDKWLTPRTFVVGVNLSL